MVVDLTVKGTRATEATVTIHPHTVIGVPSDAEAPPDIEAEEAGAYLAVPSITVGGAEGVTAGALSAVSLLTGIDLVAAYETEDAQKSAGP